RCFLDATTAARRLAWTVAGAPENSRKHVGLPIDHVGVAITPFSNQPDVFWNGGVCGAGPLAIHDLMKVVGRRDISRFHSYHVRANTRAQPSFFRRTLNRRTYGFRMGSKAYLIKAIPDDAQRQFCAIRCFHG